MLVRHMAEQSSPSSLIQHLHSEGDETIFQKSLCLNKPFQLSLLETSHEIVFPPCPMKIWDKL